VKRVVIGGATHGNEWIGAWLVERWLTHPDEVTRASFETLPLLCNPAALAERTRYIDQDLNRSFDGPSNAEGAPLESRRAAEILRQLGPNGRTPADVVLDLHTTTANMGLTYILTNRDPFNLRMAAWVKQHVPNLKVYGWIDDTLPRRSFSSIVARGATIEVGPTANNVVRGDLLLGTKSIVAACLDFVEAHNQADPATRARVELELFSHLSVQDYPRDADGRLTAFIHPEFQDRDYQPLEHGDPIFMTLDGQTIGYQGRETVYPVFINEAAYYEKGIAFSLTEKQLLNV
jgi:aspartoacylase